MIRKFTLLFVICITQLSLFAQMDNQPFGARSAAMGNASVTFIDPWAAHNNQAGLGFLENISTGIYYENKFLTKDLGLKCFTFSLPVKKAGAFGINVSNIGNRLYNESTFGLAYGMAFGKNIAAGIQLDYLRTHIGENYGQKGWFTFEAGILAKVYKNLLLGVHIFNPINVKMNKETNERIPLIYKIGLSYSFPQKACIAAELEKDLENKAIIKFGVEYHVIKPMYLRIGIATNPAVYSFGAGFEFYHFKLDIAASRHPVLGFSPQVSLNYEFHTSKK